MELKLANNEQIVKTYTYSTRSIKSNAGKENVNNNLIITNKRIINESVSKKTVIRKEIPVEAADYVYTVFATQGITLLVAIIAAVAGVLSLIIGVTTDMTILTVLGIVMLVIAVAAVIKFFLNKGAGVMVEISGKMGEHSLMQMGTSSLTKSVRLRKLKIKVDKSVSEAMVNEIGALLLDLKRNY